MLISQIAIKTKLKIYSCC